MAVCPRPLTLLRRLVFLVLPLSLVLYALQWLSAPPPFPREPAAFPHNIHDNSTFIRGISIFQPDHLSKHLVLPTTRDSDTEWVSQLPLWLNITEKYYSMDGSRRKNALKVPINKGNEAMAYLSYIIDHYNSLPDIVVFVHSHAGAWHNNDLHVSTTPLMLRELNYNRVLKHGYLNLRCHWKPGCPSWIRPKEKGFDFWKGEEYVFGDAFRNLFDEREMPDVFAAPCCAQFAVTRERILGNDREWYARVRRWVMDTDLDDWYSGRVLEYMWQYIFSPHDKRTPAVCPSEWVCYCDAYGLCFGGEKEYERHASLREESRSREDSYRLALSMGPQEGEDWVARDKGLRELKEEILQRHKVLDAQIEEARRRGRDPAARRSEMGDEFTDLL